MKFDTLQDYSEIAGIGVRVIDDDGTELFSTPQYDIVKKPLEYLSTLLDCNARNKSVLIKSCSQSIIYGGLYVFQCPLGLTHIVSPIIRDKDYNRFVVAGPMILSNLDDYLEFEILPNIESNQVDEIRETIDIIPVVGAVNVSSLSEQLFVNTRFISAGSTSSLALGVNSSQSETANTIDYYQIKSYMFKNKEEASEQYKLLKTLQSHDDTMARALYNEICEQALYHPRNNIEFIKSKIIEFIFVLYQSSVQDGADIKNVMQLKNRAIMEIDDLGDLNDVIVWLNRINDQFSNFMLKNPNSKHADVIKRAMAYILDHYDEKITLDDIANHVSFSPTYLCSLFKSETGQGFKTCLKKIRIEQSKKLMEEGALSIAEISYKVGFSDQSYFARVFKQYVGVSPYHYRLTCRAVV